MGGVGGRGEEEGADVGEVGGDAAGGEGVPVYGGVGAGVPGFEGGGVAVLAAELLLQACWEARGGC